MSLAKFLMVSVSSLFGQLRSFCQPSPAAAQGELQGRKELVMKPLAPFPIPFLEPGRPPHQASYKVCGKLQLAVTSRRLTSSSRSQLPSYRKGEPTVPKEEQLESLQYGEWEDPEHAGSSGSWR